MTQTLISLTIFAYMGIVLSIGYFFSKRNNSASEFYLGDRSLGPFVTAMSAEASDMSSWLLMGLPGVAYVSGLADPFWTALGLGIGTYVNWKYVALRLRRFSHTLDAITVPAFFSQRFADHKYRLSAVSAWIIIIFFIPYTASAFAACGKLFSSVFEIDYTTAMLFSALIILVYTVSGGFLAVSFTDTIQSIMMSFALIFVLSYVVSSVGGLPFIFDTAVTYEGFFSLFQSHTAGPQGTMGTASSYGILSTISALAWGLGYFGMPHILLRFMAIEDENKLPVARTVATTWVIFSMILAIFIGIAGKAMSHTGALPQLEDNETIIIHLAGLLAENSVGYAIVAGLILAGILAATMSTADSQLLVASSSVSQNLIMEYYRKDLSPEKGLLVARISIVLISILAMFLASNPDSSVFAIVSFAWAGFGASFGPVMLLSLFWRRANYQGAMAGLIAGGLMVFVWKFQIAPMGGIWAVYELLPAFLTGLLAMTVVSLLTPPPNHEVELIFDASMMPLPQHHSKDSKENKKKKKPQTEP